MYSFTNHFSGPGIRQRIGMMNRYRSGRFASLRYAGLLFIVFMVAFACQLIQSKSSHKYIQESGNDLFSIITAKTSAKDFDTLRQELNRRQIKLSIPKLIRLVNGQIQQLTLTVTVPKPGHPIDAVIGSSLGQSAIPAIGLWCNAKGCQLSAINDKFPKRLQQVAVREGVALSSEASLDNAAFTDANSAFGLYRVFYRNDFLESNYFGLHHAAIRMTPDYYLDLYPEYRKAVIFLDGQEISRNELGRVYALDLKKIVIFRGEAAITRLGNARAKDGLILLSRLKNISIRDKYASTHLLENAYPGLFTQP